MDSRKLLVDIITNTEDGVYFVDPKRKLTMWNPAAEKITGYTAKEIIGSRCQDNILFHIDAEGRPLCIVGCPLFETLGDGRPRTANVFLRHKDGHRIAVLVKVLPVYDKGRIIGALEIFTPQAKVAGTKELIDDLTDKVMNDKLTGLPNRAYLESFLGYKLEEFRRFGKRSCVIFMDIDNFGNFNNTYGHHVGDLALRAISASFLSNLRDTDVMGRWGGEEFVGVFAISNTADAVKLAEKVRVLVAGSEIEWEGKRINLTASVGAAILGEHDTAESVVDRADRMMYSSKKRTKNCITVENPDDENNPHTTNSARRYPVG